MQVEIVNCENLKVASSDGKADAAIRLFTSRNDFEREQDYIGFGADDLSEILKMIADSAADMQKTEATPIPDDDELAALGRVPSAMRAFLAQIELPSHKVIVFDGGEGDDDTYGFVATLVGSYVDTRAALDNADLGDAILTADDPAAPPKP